MSLEDDLLNLKEAVEITGLSEMTIRKYLGLTKPPRPSKLPNARKIRREGDTQDTWAIPLSDLYEAGLMNGKVKTAAKEDPEKPLNDLVKIALLQAENKALKEMVELLEKNLADLRGEISFHRRAIETADTQEKRRKFWQFGR